MSKYCVLRMQRSTGDKSCTVPVLVGIVKPATGRTLCSCASAYTRGNWKTQAHIARLFVDYAALSNYRFVSDQLGAFGTLDASVFTSTLPATTRRSRTCATRATDVIFERKHCSRRPRAKPIKKNTNSTQNKSQTYRAIEHTKLRHF